MNDGVMGGIIRVGCNVMKLDKSNLGDKGLKSILKNSEGDSF